MEIAAFQNFDEAARAALSFLHRRLGFGLWMVTRTVGEDWIVLQSDDHGYNVQDGTVFRWTDSFCSRMVEGLGPRIAPESNAVPAYASAPIGRQVDIAAYIGVPLTALDGTFFGTLCAIDPHVQPAGIVEELELVEMVAGLLSSILRTEMLYAEEGRKAERAQADALSDALTGLFNRRGWSRLLDGEEQRCRRRGHPAGVVAIDLDGLKSVNDTGGHFKGDELLERAGGVLAAFVRRQDVAARVGGDEFAVLLVECDSVAATTLVERLRAALTEAGVSASIGLAMRDPAQGLQHAWEEADRAMYVDKGRPR